MTSMLSLSVFEVDWATTAPTSFTSIMSMSPLACMNVQSITTFISPGVTLISYQSLSICTPSAPP